MGGGTGLTVIHNLSLIGNQQGVFLVHPFGEVRFFNNIVSGKNLQGVGISLAQGATTHIYQNTISGCSVAVEVGTEVAEAVIDENLVTLNQIGIWGRYPERSCFTIRGNRVTLNQGDGIRTGLNYSPSPSRNGVSSEATPVCSSGVGADIEDNTVALNGGNGIVVEAEFQTQQFVQDNFVSYNKENGIAVFGQPIVDPNWEIQTLGNSVGHNATDLFWDGVGTNTCWAQNVFVTSSPQVLPACQ